MLKFIFSAIRATTAARWRASGHSVPPCVDSPRHVEKIDERREMRNDLERRRLDLAISHFESRRWWQEDRLVDNRLRWLLASQTIMFAGYALAWRSLNEHMQTPQAQFWQLSQIADRPILAVGNMGALRRLYECLPFVGVLICFSIALGVWAARRAQLEIYRRNKGLQGCGVTPQTSLVGILPGLFMPQIFAAMWGWISGTTTIAVSISLTYWIAYIAVNRLVFREGIISRLITAIADGPGRAKLSLLRPAVPPAGRTE